MGKYKNENWVKNGKKWVNIRIKIRLNFGVFYGGKVGKYKNFFRLEFSRPIFSYACPRSVQCTLLKIGLTLQGTSPPGRIPQSSQTFFRIIPNIPPKSSGTFSQIFLKIRQNH